MSGGKKSIKVMSCDEVFYPAVKFLNMKLDEDKIQENDSTTLVRVVERIAESKGRRRGIRVWGSRLATVLVVIVALSAAMLVGLRFVGFQIFTVTSGSMEPDYPVGSLIYVAPVDINNLKVDDVITFMNSEETTVTHRVSEVVTETNVTGEQVLKFRTKGDANDAVDGKLVHYKNVVGAPVVTIPGLGYVVYYLQRPPGIYIALIICTFLVSLITIPYAMKFKGKEKTATVTRVSS